HPARAALRNPRRSILRGVITEAAWRELGRDWREGLEPQIVPAEKVGQMLPPGAVHQGVAILCEPLSPLDLAQLIEAITPHQRRIAVLDQVTDPHHEGSILRSASAVVLASGVVTY